MFDTKGGEFFVILSLSGTVKQNRMDKQKALDAIADAIEGGKQPGAVTLNG